MRTIRPFTSQDRPACLDIYQANLSRGLIPSQYAAEFEAQLADSSTLTLVCTVDDRLVACGSVSCSAKESAAWLSFGMVHPDFQRRGIGSTMILIRMSLLEPTEERPCNVHLSATSHSKGFFAKHGFAWRGSDGDRFGNQFEHFCFPLTQKLVQSIRNKLRQAHVNYDANLQVPNRDTLTASSAL